MTRPRTLLRASTTCGSLAASIALIAQMGLSPAHFRSTSQRRLVATKMFSAKWSPRRSAVMRCRLAPMTTAGELLVGGRRVAFEAVDGAGLGGPEGDPVAGRLLQQDEELLGPLHRHRVPLVLALELALVRKLAHQLLFVAAGAPDRHVGLGLHPLAEVEHADVEQHLLD